MKLEYKTFPFEVKSADDDSGVIDGYASTFGNIDHGQDTVLKGAFEKTIAEKKGVFPILADHWPDQHIGWNESASEDDVGLRVKGLLDIKENQKAREKHSLAKMAKRLGTSLGLSIGYTPVQWDYMEIDGKRIRRLKEVRLWEYSLVTFPMNEQAFITGAKSWTERVTKNDTLSDSTILFLETMRRKGYTDSELKKALLDGAAAILSEPEEDFHSAGKKLDELLTKLRQKN